MQKIAKSHLPVPAIDDDYKARRETIECAIRVWAKNQPPGVVNEFLAWCSRFRSSMSDPKGFTNERFLLRLIEIPARLRYMMNVIFGFEWRNDAKTMYPFLDALKRCRMNLTTRPILNPDKIGEDNSGTSIAELRGESIQPANILGFESLDDLLAASRQRRRTISEGGRREGKSPRGASSSTRADRDVQAASDGARQGEPLPGVSPEVRRGESGSDRRVGDQGEGNPGREGTEGPRPEGDPSGTG